MKWYSLSNTVKYAELWNNWGVIGKAKDKSSGICSDIDIPYSEVYIDPYWVNIHMHIYHMYNI